MTKIYRVSRAAPPAQNLQAEEEEEEEEEGIRTRSRPVTIEAGKHEQIASSCMSISKQKDRKCEKRPSASNTSPSRKRSSSTPSTSARMAKRSRPSVSFPCHLGDRAVQLALPVQALSDPADFKVSLA